LRAWQPAALTLNAWVKDASIRIFAYLSKTQEDNRWLVHRSFNSLCAQLRWLKHSNPHARRTLKRCLKIVSVQRIPGFVRRLSTGSSPISVHNFGHRGLDLVVRPAADQPPTSSGRTKARIYPQSVSFSVLKLRRTSF
jgi:hypothetical protein